MSPAPTHYTTAGMERRHERHGCPNHPAPGVCVGCGQEWPCDARRLLDLMSVVKFAGVLDREARSVSDGWTRYAGTIEKDGDGDTATMGAAVVRLRGVLAAIDGEVSDPIEYTRARR